MKRILISAILMLTAICSQAYYPTVRNYTKSTYMAGAQNWCIEQNDKGVIWFANTGILEYDGQEWKNTMTRNHTSVRSLFYDHETQRLYFGASNEFGYIHINENGKKEYVSISEKEGIVAEEIWAIHKTHGKVWFRDNNCIYMYTEEGIRKAEFGNKINCSSIVGDELYLHVSGEGLYRLSRDGRFAILKQGDELKRTKICAIIPYEGDKALVIGNRNCIYILEGDKTRRITDEFPNELLRENIFCAATDKRYISFGTISNGVYIYDTKVREMIHLNTSTGLQNNTVLSMYHDMSGNLWLGLDKGIDMVQLSAPDYRLFGNPDIFGSGYTSEFHDGRLWLGTNQGLFHINEEMIEKHCEDKEIIKVDAIEGQIWDILSYDDRLFICHDGGIDIINDGRKERIPLNGTWKLEPLRGNGEYMIGSTYDRLFLVKKTGARWRFHSWIEGFNEASKVFETDSEGNIWFSHWLKGLFRFNLNLEESRVTDVSFFSKGNGFPEDWGNIPLDINGEIVFTTTQGLYKYDRYSNNVYPLEKLNERFGNPTGSAHIAISSNGNAYISNRDIQGVCYTDSAGRYIIDTLSLQHLKTKRLPGFEDILQLTDSTMLINTEDGFSIIRLDRLAARSSYAKAKVIIREICTRTANEDCLIYSSWGNDAATCSLKLPYSDNSLRFRCAESKHEEGNTSYYSFKLENYDNWSPFSENGIKEYTKLPHGRYIFHVRAYDSFSMELSEDSIEVIIDEPWYLSPYAIVVYILILIIAILAILKAVLAIAQFRARKMTEKKEEEMRHEQVRLDLEHKADDLAESTMNLIRKNEILLDIDSDLEKMADYIVEDRNKSLKILSKIRKDIRENINHDNAWLKFEENFDLVYSDYLKRLSMQYPNLTLSDKKMCAYLKMDLSSKEIAPLLNITVRSVEMTRYRLRKKLGLSHEENLTEFLHNF